VSRESPSDWERAFEQYYDQWSEPVYRYLMHLVGSAETAADLFQDTWMKALEHRRELKDPERFGAWILRIARNLAFNTLRQQKRKAQVWVWSNLAAADTGALENPAERRPSPDPSPRDEAITAQRRRIIEGAIGELDLETQEMLQLRYFQHLTLAEISSVLTVPLGTVCTKIHRALKTIRERLERLGYTDLHEI
jgi:RNA polymerase sigma-70 factor (ECF subfamily)